MKRYKVIEGDTVGVTAYECDEPGIPVGTGFGEPVDTQTQVWVKLEDVQRQQTLLRNGIIEYEKRTSDGLIGTRFCCFYFAGAAKGVVGDGWGVVLFVQQIGNEHWNVMNNDGPLYGASLALLLGAVASGRAMPRKITDADKQWLLSEIAEDSSKEVFQEIVEFLKIAEEDERLFDLLG